MRRLSLFILAVVIAAPVLAVTQGRRPSPAAARGVTNLKEFLPLAHARFFGDAELTLLNNGPEPVAVTPRWLIHDLGFIEGDVIRAEPHTPQFLPITGLLPPGVALTRVDGLEIAYQGRAVMHVSAQMTLLPKSGSQANQSLDVPPTIPVDVRGPRLEAVWAAPRHDEQAVIVLSNLTSTQRSVSVTGPSTTQRLSMHPWTVQSLTFPSQPTGSVDWLRVEGDQSGLRATGFVMSRADRIPRLIRFYDPKAAARSDIWANGVRLGDSSLAILLKNTLDAAVLAKADLLDPKDGTVLVDFPAVNLAPGTGTSLDLGPVARASLGVPTAVVRVNSSSSAGSLVGSIYTLDSATGLQQDAPLRDSAWDNTSYRRLTGNCAWRLDGDYNTRVTIANVGDSETGYRAIIQVSGSSDYIAGARKLAPGASATFDLRQIRDEQVQDAAKRTLPANADRGRCHWSVVSHGQPRISPRLMGRAEIVSISRRVSSTHSW